METLPPALNQSLAYEERIKHLHDRGIGVWDVYSACVRPTSADTDIRNATRTNVRALKRRAPMLARVCFNGVAAAAHELDYITAGYETIRLPSSSPRHATKTFAQKSKEWSRALK